MKYLLLLPLLLLFSFNVLCQEAGEPEDPNEEPAYNSPEDWCPPQPCNCSFTVDRQGNADIVVGEGQTVCLSGTFTVNRNIRPVEGASNYSICILPGANITLQDRPGPDAGGLDRLQGNWTLYNNGSLTSQGISIIKYGKFLYNYGDFSTSGGALVIEAGGLFCSSGDAIIDGDIRNSGEMRSSGDLHVNNEFKNFGVAYIKSMTVDDEITNYAEGTLNLQGSIESIGKSFKNEGIVYGLESPCNSIKAKNSIINDGHIDGSAGPIGIGKDEGDFSGGGTIIDDVFYTDSEDLENINEDCFRILPVIFIDFETILYEKQRSAMLIWSTSKEWENSHFVIQRSLDGAVSFEKIGEVAGMGWTDEVTEYVYEDNELPLAGGNVFYRLKQVDFNGKYEYSEITAVRVPNVHFTQGVWRAYPNPSNGSDFQLELVDMSQYHDEAVTLRVLSSTISSGEMVYKNLQELSSAASAIMTNAPKGLWIIELQWGNKVERIKVMKK